VPTDVGGTIAHVTQDDADAAVDEAADLLYAVPPRDFVPARDARVKELRAAGEPDAARAVAALRRPTVVAWLANQLVRRHGDQVGPLLDLGVALREATATLSGPQLRGLSRQRHQVIAALVGQARRLAAAEGQPVTEDAARGLEQTLTAALADEAAGELLRSGRLTDALVPGGFGDAPTTAGARRPAKPAKRAAKPTDDPEAAERAARRAALEAELAEAWAAARAAADARTDAEEAARSAESASREAARTAERLRGELAEAESTAASAERARSAATGARDDAREVAELATRRVSELQRALDEA
jgi:hypothetical protein